MKSSAQDRYVRRVLELYRTAPGTRCRVRPADRRLAVDLFQRGVPIERVSAAFLVVLGRRILRPRAAGPLAPIASLHYFQPVIQELLDSPPDTEYIEYLRCRLSKLEPQVAILDEHPLS